MPSDPREIVAKGYDAAAAAYEEWLITSVVDTARVKYRDALCGLLPERATVLELGCGGGGPTTARLAERFALTGIDISATQIAMARERLPHATFLEVDMTRFATTPSSFDGVAAFYSLIHLPYGELPAMLGRISRWLRAGGVFVASLGARGSGEHLEPEWLGGAPMYWSGYTPDENVRFLEQAGLAVIEANVETSFEDGDAMPTLWVLATKPSESS